uniref:Piezo-type mechanosensitive ion channel component n=1 Tax=Heterorhabditis bacteriophora TaxID=37862 RepID=A0A1I7WEX4_HETBA
MIPPVVKAFFYRGFLPLTLFFAAFLRPCFLSLGYVILALISPILPSIQPVLPLPGSIRFYGWGTFLYCFLIASGQLGYQIYETVIHPNEKDYVLRCNSTELKWWRYMGFIRFHGGNGFESTRSILPEILSVFVTLLSTIIVTVLPHRSEELDVVGSVQAVRTHDSRTTIDHFGGTVGSIYIALKRFSNFAIIVVSAIVGCVQPSVLNSTYFLAFLFVASWWSLYRYSTIFLWFKWCGQWMEVGTILVTTTKALQFMKRWAEISNFRSNIVFCLIMGEKIGTVRILASGQNETTAAQGVVAIISFFLHHAYTFSLLSMMVLFLIFTTSIFYKIYIIIYFSSFSYCVYLEQWKIEMFYNSLSEHERSRRIQSYGTFSDASRRLPADISSSYGSHKGREEYPATIAVRWLSHQVAKYWIVFVALVLLFVACQPHPVLYTIGFFCIWSLLILYFKASFSYSKLDVWSRWTKLDRKWNDDIGLINYSNVGESGTLFVRLLTPISLFVVTMLQLKFFHEPWSDMVQPVRIETELEVAPGPSTVGGVLIGF